MYQHCKFGQILPSGHGILCSQSYEGAAQKHFQHCSNIARGIKGHCHRHEHENEEAVEYVLHMALSWVQLRASPANRPQSEWIWYSQVVGGRPRSLCQLENGGISSRTSDAVRKTALAGMFCCFWHMGNVTKK